MQVIAWSVVLLAIIALVFLSVRQDRPKPDGCRNGHHYPKPVAVRHIPDALPPSTVVLVCCTQCDAFWTTLHPGLWDLGDFQRSRETDEVAFLERLYRGK